MFSQPKPMDCAENIAAGAHYVGNTTDIARQPFALDPKPYQTRRN
jgi:hypothetical protein